MNLTITPNFTQLKNSQQNPSSRVNTAGGGGEFPLSGLNAIGAKIFAFPAAQNNQSSNLAPLARDTVSFGANIAHHLEHSFAGRSERLNRIATVYLDVVESIANILSDQGFSFDRAYCELHPVKSAKACAEKVARSSSFNIRDRIRTTMYCRNINDLNVLVHGLLPEMSKRGYVLADTQMAISDLMKRGYKPTAKEMSDLTQGKTVKDLDIRLEDVSEQVAVLPQALRYSIGKPQKSGYEDIQIRFIRDFADDKKHPVFHELIILAGPNTAMAKARESELVYSNLRKFDKLHLNISSDAAYGTDENKAYRYIDLIQQMFRGKVSQKEFENAKNKDLYDIFDEIPIGFSDTDIILLKNYFKSLVERFTNIYKAAKKHAASSAEKRQLSKELRDDVKLLSEIEVGLNKTINYYNKQNTTAVNAGEVIKPQ